MNKISIPKGLPKSKIIDELTLKSEARIGLVINPLSLLDDFRKLVSDQARYIIELFPEYTPHDEQYHLSRLFIIADMVLGDKLIEDLNFSELFILALSLYGHAHSSAGYYESGVQGIFALDNIMEVLQMDLTNGS